MAVLDRAEGLRLVEASPVARLATVRADGAPHIVPCCFALRDQSLYSIVDGKPKSTAALRRLENVRANPRVSLIVDHYSDDWTELWWVRVDGMAAVAGDRDEDDKAERADAIALLQAKYPQYRADPPAGSLLRVDVTAVTGWIYDATKVPESGQQL